MDDRKSWTQTRTGCGEERGKVRTVPKKSILFDRRFGRRKRVHVADTFVRRGVMAWILIVIVHSWIAERL